MVKFTLPTTRGSGGLVVGSNPQVNVSLHTAPWVPSLSCCLLTKVEDKFHW